MDSRIIGHSSAEDGASIPTACETDGGSHFDRVDCPRCHEQCGWCSDYRWMHGTVRLPSSKRYCTIAAMQPDERCDVCLGTLQVLRSVRYSPLTAPAANRQAVL